MRRIPRFILLLMLVVLPLQTSLAVAGAYCSHETGPAEHLGHHYHEHQNGTTESDGDRGNPGVSHDDCGTCQAGTGALTTAHGRRGPVPESNAIDPGRAARLAPHPVFEPEKPNWPRLA